MTVGLLPAVTDEQAMLVDASIRFMEAEHPVGVVRRCADGADYPADAYRKAAATLGWFGFLGDEGHGGGSVSGNGVADAALIAAERGARLQPGPYAGHEVVVHALSSADGRPSPPVLASLVEGESWATWVDGAEQVCVLSADGDGLRLDGRLDVVADGPECGWLLVGAAGPDGPMQVLVATDAPGVTVRPMEGLDVTRRWCAIEFAGVELSADAVVDGDLSHQAQLAAVLVAAETVGAMHADLELAVQYAKDRIAFGRPIGSFQAIKHLLADTSLWLEMGKGLVAAAAMSLGANEPEGPELAHAARSFVADKSMELAHNCFQVFGGIAYTWEHDQHLYFRRMAANAVTFGSAAAHREQMLDVMGVTR